jgi:hypothetical protein
VTAHAILDHDAIDDCEAVDDRDAPADADDAVLASLTPRCARLRPE